MLRWILYNFIIYTKFTAIHIPILSRTALAMQCCNLCQTTFASRNQLFEHLQIAHGYNRDANEDSNRNRTELQLAARAQLANPHHDAYYQAQCDAGVMTAEDWMEAKQFFLRPLNTAFRIQTSASESARRVFLERIEQQCDFESSPYFSSRAGRVATRPPREWSSPKAVSDAQDVGAAHRQELSSMVPPLLLFTNTETPQPVHVLDLCAAPGSKSLQILDLLPSNGMLIANDAQRSRALTISRRARLNANKKHCLIINSSDGRHFPSLRKWGGYKFKFDAVLADVPCSGDGTLRKLSSSEWGKWSIPHHLSLHKLQLQLLTRSLQLVKKGGRVVYSTCSLDPIENEAVVTSAIWKMGGPSVYRIVPPPQFLQEDAMEPFVFSPGASSWVVPDPKFSADYPRVYQTLQQVPEELRRRLPVSMFPPRSRQEADLLASGDEEMDITAIEAMLPNCCRILPQHLDSGGFFCAIIERVVPNYFAVCYPKQRAVESISKTHHGRIYHCGDVASIQALVQADKKSNEEVYYEGWPTVEAAQQWLRQHSAYVVGRSEMATAMPDREVQPSIARIDGIGTAKSYQRTPIYTPLFTPPHPALVQEFLNFFGLCTATEEAAGAGVERFPVEHLVMIGGGESASTVTTCLNIDDSATDSTAVTKKQKVFRLTLISESVRSLYAGGAKFNPIEIGMSLCSVSVMTGQYGLFDEAVEFIGRCATKRIIPLSKQECIQLLEHETIRISDLQNNFWPTNGKWWEELVARRDALLKIQPGPMIAVGLLGSTEKANSTVFFSCNLLEDYSLHLLTEKRVADAWVQTLRDQDER